MGQAGAQREPSMEEILASIRRIIENNEPGPDGRPADPGQAFNQHDADDSAADDGAYDADYMEQASERPRAVANDVPVAQQVSLADVAARARAAPESRSANAHSTEIHEEDAGTASDVMDTAAEELREALTSDEPVGVAAKAIAVEKTQDEPVAAQPEPEPELEPQPEPVLSAPSPEVRAPSAQQPGGEQSSGGQLVSLQTGEKVAAAFSELDAAIAAGQRRSFDEIAEEMLRPMLTQWLDDNLPTLVERLVREEIERVSRGNRR
jgi:uncharacterized protein